MSQENICLLCTTENAKYDKEFLSQRAYFSAPQLKELRVKWNEALIKIHPVLEQLVNNINTYKICDLHFKESDIKKTISEKSSHQNICTLPLWNWVLKIKALPLSAKELENDKYQIFNKAKEKSKENLNNLENNVVYQDHTYMDIKRKFNSENNNQMTINLPIKKIDEFKEVKQIQKLKPKKNVKFTPYSINSDKKKIEINKISPILQLQSAKNQVLVVTSESLTPPINSSIISVNSKNSISPTLKYPIISNVTSLSQNNQKLISIHNVKSQLNYPSNVIPISSLVPISAKSSITNPIVAKKSMPFTFANSIPDVSTDSLNSHDEKTLNSVIQLKQKITEQSQEMKTSSTIMSSTSNIIYNRLKLIADLKQNSLPCGWAYKIEEDDKILFTQYYTFRKFPIFLSIDKNLKPMISVGYEAVKFISHDIQLNSFADVCKGLCKLEMLKWCLGIGFDQNNHSDNCLILTKKLNSRCPMCSKIRRNAQKHESNEITKQRKQSKDLRPLVQKLKRINARLENKMCKLKLMVNHLKKKQCPECLHNKFLEKNSILESESSTTINN